MNCLRWYGSSAHLVNCAFHQMRCAVNHFIKTAQRLINCAIFGQSRSALAIGLRLRLGLGLVRVRGLGSGRLVLELGLGLGLHNWPNAQRVWSNAHIDQMRLIARFFFTNFTENLQFQEKKEYAEILSNVELHVERSTRIILRLHYFLVISYRLWLCAKDSICAAKLRI